VDPPEHALADLVDLERLQRLFDSLSAALDIALAVLDPAGTILIASGWQDICTKFHRKNEETLRGCLESDLRINRQLRGGLNAPEHYSYKCANGLWDVAFPLIVGGEHLANIFTGQFFFEDDDVDAAAFAARARRLGFDETAYLEALARVPVLPRARLERTIDYLADFVGMLGELGMSTLQREQKHEELRESERRYRRLFDNTTEGVMVFHVMRGEGGALRDLMVVDVNPSQTTLAHAGREELIGRKMSEDEGGGERLRAYFDLVANAVASGQAARSELHVRAEDANELLTTYPAGRELWALQTLDVTEIRRAERALHRQEEDIRRAYVDVLDAVTGGKLILLTEEALAEELGRPLCDEMPISSAAQLAEARRVVVAAADRQYPRRLSHTDLLSSVCEALSNALQHARGGTYQVFANNGSLQVAITDQGPGIDFRTLPRATLMPGFSTAASLGMGFTIMLQLCARVLLSTRPGHTRVVLEFAAKRAAAPAE
jgi:ligand-binding sensor protein/anti-sigma regulatory factor (Ser/Thr protein kinase)